MLGQQFYHETVRNVVVSFGTIFNNIQLVRKDNSGVIQQTMKVPLAYGPRQKFLVRLNDDADLSKAAAVTLPRIGFEITGLTYDPGRKLNRVQKFKKVKSDTSKTQQLDTQYMPVPYNINFQLYILAKQSDDALQIVEQILPYFQPDYTITMNDNPDMGVKKDVPVILNSISYEDDYQGDFTTRRWILLVSSIYMVLLHPVRLLRQCRLMHILICLIKHPNVNRDLLLHQIPQLLMQMMILVLTRCILSLKMRRLTIQ